MSKISTISFVGLILFILLANPKDLIAAITFTISNPQVSEETVTIDVSLSGLTSSSCQNNKCYLQAAIKKEGGQYFGFTENNLEEWYEYQNEPGKENIASNFFNFEPIDGTWNGILKLKFDPNDSKYKGPGTYVVNAWRYSGKSDSSTDGSDETIEVELTVQKTDEIEKAEKENSDFSTVNNITSNKSTSSPKSSKKSPTPTPKVLATSTKKQEAPQANNIEDSISQIDTNQFNPPSPAPQENNSQQKVAGILVSAGAVLVGISLVGFVWYKKQEDGLKIHKGKEQFEEDK